MKTANRRALTGALELKEADDAENVVTKALADLTKTVDDRLKAVEAKSGESVKLTERFDKLEAKMNRPAAANSNVPAADNDNSIERKAFQSYLRFGRDAMPDEDRKSLTVAPDTSGGYLAPSDVQTEILKNIVAISPMRLAARVSSTAAGEVILPKRVGRPTGQWVGETEDRTATGSTYGQVEIPVHEMACYVDVSLKLLEDVAVNIEAEVAFDVGQEFGRMEGAVFISGNGTKKPLGFLNSADVAYVATGNAATLGTSPSDLLITAFYAMPIFYRNTGSWMMNGNTVATIRKLKDGQGNYLWQPAYVAGQPETILGRPVIEAPDMPDIGAGFEPIAFGDFSMAYRIFDRVGMSIFADPYTVRASGLIRFQARRRVGGNIVLAEAIRKIRCAVS
jgi:HK97 family phage major capsid protein